VVSAPRWQALTSAIKAKARAAERMGGPVNN